MQRISMRHPTEFENWIDKELQRLILDTDDENRLELASFLLLASIRVFQTIASEAEIRKALELALEVRRESKDEVAASIVDWLRR